MNFSGKLIRTVLVVSVFSLQPFFACAAGIDDVTNYKSPVPQVLPSTAQPYTIQEIISILPNSLNKDGVYEPDGEVKTKQNAWLTSKYKNDPRAIAFDVRIPRKLDSQSTAKWTVGA